MLKRLSEFERIEVLEEENRQLRDEIARLNGRNEIEIARRAFNLTNAEAIIFTKLLRCGMAEHGALQEAVYTYDYVDVEDPTNAIRAHMKRMRKKIRPFGVDFQTVYSLGWRMSEECRAIARAFISKAECVQA